MRVEPRSLRSHLPEPSELRPTQPRDIPAEEMRLGPAGAPSVDLASPLEPPPPIGPRALAELAAAVSRLGDDDRDAAALAALDDAGRQRMAPALSKVRAMAKTVDALLELRRQAMGRLRAQGQG